MTATAITGTTATMAATAKTLTLGLAALIVSACSHAAAPPAVSPQNQAKAHSEIRTGVHAFGQNAYRTSLAHFNRAVAFDPNSVDARYDRALAEEMTGAYGHAADDLQAVVWNKPAWNEARLHLAAAQFHARRYADAAQNFDIVLRSNPKNWSAWLDDGVAYYKMKRYAQARQHFARALALAPKSGRAHFWLGMAYRNLGNRPKARGELALAAHSQDVIVRTAARRQLIGR